MNDRSPSTKRDCIYIVRDMGKESAYKIGVSNEPTRRKGQLQTGNPDELKVMFALEVEDGIKALDAERIIHNYLKEQGKWIRGEWFRLESDTDVLNLAIAMMRIGYNITPFERREHFMTRPLTRSKYFTPHSHSKYFDG